MPAIKIGVRVTRSAIGREYTCMGLSNPLHIAILVLVVVLLFGAKRLPELGRSLGSGIREFKGTIDPSSSPEKPAAVAEKPAAERS